MPPRLTLADARRTVDDPLCLLLAGEQMPGAPLGIFEGVLCLLHPALNLAKPVLLGLALLAQLLDGLTLLVLLALGLSG